jgi:hypothetical protein
MARTLVLDKEQQRLGRYVRILRLLAETEHKLNKNQIWRSLKGKGFGSEPTILYAIDDLRKWGMVHLVETPILVTGGNTFNYYNLTPTGVENLICAGVLSTKSISLGMVKFLLEKYRETVPYATQISELWPIFAEAGVEELAVKRLAMFIAVFHGEKLYYYARNPDGPPIRGPHVWLNMTVGDLAENIGHSSLNCTEDDDVEAFLDPCSQFYGLGTSYEYEGGVSDKEHQEWIMVIRSNEELQSIVARATLKEALSNLRSSNLALETLSQRRITLKGTDSETYKDVMREIESLRSKIVIE